jgi:hypothetical protein
MKKIILSVIAILAFAVSTIGQNVNIPDAIFKYHLVSKPYINTNNDQEIQVSEAIAYTGVITCRNESIADLTGIEEFTGLVALYCSGNLLDSLDLSQNTKLVRLWCGGNSLTTLDLSNNPDLIEMYCSGNQLHTLNVASGNNPNLVDFGASDNPDLFCITVDDIAWSVANWDLIDETQLFNTYCEPAGSVNNQDLIQSIVLYPNPANDQLRIEKGSLKIESIIVVDVLGNLVKTVTPFSTTVNIIDLEKGIYFLRIQTDNGLVNKKFNKI